VGFEDACLYDLKKKKKIESEIFFFLDVMFCGYRHSLRTDTCVASGRVAQEGGNPANRSVWPGSVCETRAPKKETLTERHSAHSRLFVSELIM